MYRVAEFIPTLSNGGAEVLVKDYAMNIDKEKFDLTVIILWDLKNSTNSKILRENNIPYITIFEKFNVFHRVLFKLFGKRYVAHKLYKIIKEKDIQCLHIHLHLLDCVRIISKKIKNIGLIFTCHSNPEDHFINEREKANLKYLVKNNNLRIIALHENMVDTLNDMFSADNTTVILNGIDITRFTTVKEDKESIRKDLAVPKDAFVVGHVGRFEKPKNHELIVEVFNEFSKQREDAYLILVGYGSLIESTKKRIKELGLEEKVKILSFRTDIPRILKAMDVFFFPSVFEGLGISLIEAQIVGLPCVVSTAISEMAIISDKVAMLDLDEPLEKWCDALNGKVQNKKGALKAQDYNIKEVMKKLESLYIEEINRKFN